MSVNTNLQRLYDEDQEDRKNWKEWGKSIPLEEVQKTEHYKLANELCTKAMEFGEEKARWLYAATLDRYLLSSGSKFQKFGTQYEKNDQGLWELCPVKQETTDEVRAQYNVFPLAKLKEREKDLNS